jgi:hypothetical protein
MLGIRAACLKHLDNLSLIELSDLNGAIDVIGVSNASLFAVRPFALKLTSTWPHENPESVDYTVFPLSEVLAFVGPLVLTLTVKLVVEPFTDVAGPVLPDIATNALLDPVAIATYIA